MKLTKGRFVLASLGGAIIIHAVLVACGGGGSSGNGDSLLDAVAAIVDSETHEAQAGEPTCCQAPAPQPPASENPKQWAMGKAVVRLFGGEEIPLRAKLADGPLFLERAVSDSYGVAELYLGSADDCVEETLTFGQVGWTDARPNQVSYQLSQSTPSGRAFVPQGKVLCARGVYARSAFSTTSVTVSWQGFRPY